MIVIALLLVVTTVVLVIGVLWNIRLGEEPGASATRRSTRAAGPGTAAEGPPAGAFVQHRWSERRPRLELTEGGIRRTGHQVRFCLDCPAEKSEEQP